MSRRLNFSSMALDPALERQIMDEEGRRVVDLALDEAGS